MRVTDHELTTVNRLTSDLSSALVMLVMNACLLVFDAPRIEQPPLFLSAVTRLLDALLHGLYCAHAVVLDGTLPVTKKRAPNTMRYSLRRDTGDNCD